MALANNLWAFVVWVLLILFGPIIAMGQSSATAQIDWAGLLWGIVIFVLDFGQGAIGAAIAVALVDGLLRLVPPLRPFREAILQWIKWALAEIKKRQATSAVLEAGQLAKNGSIPKDERLNYAIGRLTATGVTANPNEAQSLAEEAIAKLKAMGVNP